VTDQPAFVPGIWVRTMTARHSIRFTFPISHAHLLLLRCAAAARCPSVNRVHTSRRSGPAIAAASVLPLPVFTSLFLIVRCCVSLLSVGDCEMVPGFWLLEGGQSATGALLNHVIDSHVLGPQLRQQALEQKVTVSSIIHTVLLSLQQQESLPSFHLLTASLHVLPYHHGNRSPRADSSLLGAYSGLTLSHSLQSLALLYLATLQAIAYGTRHIISTLTTSTSSPITRLFLCGGLSRSALFTQTMADVMGMEVRLKGGVGGEDSDAMLLGSGMIAASACGEWGGLREAMAGMCGEERVVSGVGKETEVGSFHERKYGVFLQMYEDQMRYRQMMQDG
jgi:D-ribulokinase